MTEQEAAKVKVVSSFLWSIDYKPGYVGQPTDKEGMWLIQCPLCHNMSNLDEEKIVRNDDGTVSTAQPLHCHWHGNKKKQSYHIEHNEVKLL